MGEFKTGRISFSSLKGENKTKDSKLCTVYAYSLPSFLFALFAACSQVSDKWASCLVFLSI